MTGASERWIRFLRQYGPIPQNDNMFDEHIRKSADRLKVDPILFTHPLQDKLLRVFGKDASPQNAVLTGTAGDGKSHLCGHVWRALGGSTEEWRTDEVYFQLQSSVGGQSTLVHVIRDLTALPDKDKKGRYETKAAFLENLSTILFDTNAREIFLLAANDGQLIETWQKIVSASAANRASAVFEACLMGDKDPEEGARLAFFNLSRVPSATVFDLSLNAFLNHQAWQDCYADAEDDGFFSLKCPIRKNYELLKSPLVRSRLRALFQLCDFNELHIPIRRMLMLLSNAVLGHPEARDRLLLSRDVRRVLSKGSRYKSRVKSDSCWINLPEAFPSRALFGVRCGHRTRCRVPL